MYVLVIAGSNIDHMYLEYKIILYIEIVVILNDCN